MWVLVARYKICIVKQSNSIWSPSEGHYTHLYDQNNNYYTYKNISSTDLTTPLQLQSTSVSGHKENECKCSETCTSAVIAVSAVSLLLIVALTIVILTQCLLIIKIRKPKDVPHIMNETYAEVMTPTTKDMDVPVTHNEAYALHKITSSTKEVTYELVK